MRRSLTGRRDDVYLSLVRSSGNTGAAITYGLPVGRLGTRLSVGYFNDTTKIVSGPIAELHVTGKATAWSLSARHPWFTSADLQLDALASWKQRHTANLIESTQLTASKQHSASVGVEGQWLDARGFWGGSLELASGSNQPVGIESRSFKALRGNLRRTQALTPDWTLNGSLNWQYARVMLLPASEQIQLGGEGSVRGYQPGIYSGDRGWVTNAELQRKIRMNMAPDWSSSVLAFIDHGQVTPFRPDNNSLGSDKLSAVGLGVNLGWKDQLTARLVVGKPVSAPTGVSSGARAHVQVNWTAL
jgi:hemolysin activation/secretion protein